MRSSEFLKKGALAAAALALSAASWAVTVTPSSLSVAVGATQTVTLSGISGTLTVASSAPTVASVSKVDTTHYKVKGVAAGSATISFKDSTGTKSVAVTVTSSAAVLQGRLLASNCFQCHGTNGSSGAFDALAGDGSADTYNKLKEFAAKASSSNNVMAAHATGYTDAQMKQIAAYFASIR